MKRPLQLSAIRPALIPLLGLSLLGSVATASSAGEGEPDGPPPIREAPGPGPHGPHGAKGRILDHLLRLDDAELAELRQTIERIERLTPEERLAMRKRLNAIQRESPGRLQEIRERYEAIPEERRAAMRERWMQMTPEERREWHRKLRDMSPEERQAAMEEAGFFPPKQ